jgi:pimeloyl-ACP methyl ester carboxylesterase
MTAVEQARHYELPVPSGVRLSVREAGLPGARAVIGLHGLGGTRDAIQSGSLLERNGLRTVFYDARGHGRSSTPADPAAYGYGHLTEDLHAVVDATGPAHDGRRPILLGVSMGGLTALRLVLEAPELIAGLVLVTPAFDPRRHPLAVHAERARLVAGTLRRRDVVAFVDAEPVPVDDPHVARVLRASGQRQFDSHRDLDAVADAIETVMSARPFESLERLAGVSIPVFVVGSRDELDRNHPLDIARAYAAALSATGFALEPPGSIPFAWRGRQLARLTLAFAREQGLL